MTTLPKGWVEASAMDVCEVVQSGGTPKVGFVEEAGIPFLKVYNIVDQKVSFDYRPQFVTPDINTTVLKKSRTKPADVIMNIVGPPLGKVAIIPNTYPEWNINQAITLFRPSDAVSSEWLYILLCSGNNIAAIKKETRGIVGQVNISLSQCRHFQFPIPPVAEQKRIITKVESLTAKSTRAREELGKISALVANYKKALLASAFKGELTNTWRGDASIKTFDAVPWSVPSTWEWKRINDIGRVALGRQRSPVNHNGPNMRPYVRAANITWSGWDLSDVKEMNFDEADFARYALKPGDVLVNEGSGSAKEVGKPAIWRGEIEDCCFQNTLIRVQPAECTSEFLYFYILYNAVDERFVSKTQGVNIYHIGKEGLAQFPFPLPPLEEQHEIVRRIEAAFARIDRLATEAKRALDLTDRLHEKILAKAFRGELVPQDPNDEPASILLERIRAERAAAPKARRGRAKVSIS